MQAMKAARHSLSMVQVEAGGEGVIGFVSEALDKVTGMIKEFFTVKLPDALLNLVEWVFDQGMDMFVTMIMSSYSIEICS